MAPLNVNVPTDRRLKERDINRKLQLYGIYSAFKNGKVPSNKQIDIALNSLLSSEAMMSPSDKLSAEGHLLVSDLRDVISNAKTLILVKNQDNLLQQFIWDAEHLGEPRTTQAPGMPIDRDSAKDDRQRAVEGLKTLGTLMVTNGQFRKLLRDATLLLREMVSDTAQKATGRIKPSEEELAQIDQPAEENVWHEKPELSKDKLKSQAKSRVGQQKPAIEESTQRTAEATDRAARPAGPEGGVDAIGGAAAGTQAAAQQASERIPEGAKARSRELTERTKDFLREKMPQERRDQTIWRLKRMIVEIQGHPDYQRAIETLLSLADTYTTHGKGISQQGTTSAKGLVEEYKETLTLLKTIMERFANNTSSDDLFDYIKDFYDAADNDPRLRDWFSSVNSFTRKCLREQGYVLEDSATEQWNRLYDEGRFLLRDRYRDNTNQIVDEIKYLGDQFDRDPLNKAFGDSLQKLFHDLGYDVDGRIIFKDHLRKDVTSVIIPTLFEKIRYVPVPRIELSDPMVDVVIDNLVIESDNLMPNVVELSSDNYWRWGRKRIGNKHNNKVMIAATGMQTDWRDVSYYVKKKSGFPAISDIGVMDILMSGEGFNFKISGSNSNEPGSLINPEKVIVNVNNLDIKLKKSKHKLLFAIFKPLLFGIVRPAVEKVLEKQIHDSFVRGDAWAYEIHNRARGAWDAAHDEGNGKRSIYSYYFDAVRNKIMETKKEAERKEKAGEKRDTKVNLAVTEPSALFRDIKLPGGISSKATEYENLAREGNKWESPVFSIGSASPSTGLPSLPPITRRSHARGTGFRPGARDSGVGIEEPSSRLEKVEHKKGAAPTKVQEGPHIIKESTIIA
ncbi:hypothetical protein FQN51_006834 [Onygenales sp. PD_10]|nr:hypothetical protein FQN51_006834 [Onygenales sp. PD_10]